MADTSVEITSGTGTNIDTRTEATNGNHRQVVVVGDPSTNAGVAPVDATAGLKVDLGADNDVTVAGVATAAKQDTIIGHVDGVETLLGTIDADTSNISTKIDTVAGAVSGTEMQVDVVAALPAGTNNIGDVDVFSNTAKDGSGTRYQPLVDTDGHLQVDVLSGGGSGTQYTEADTDASITGTAVMWEDTSDTLRAVSASKPLPVGDAGGSLTVDYATTGSGTATGAIRVELPTNGTGVVGLNAGTNAIGKLAANSGVDIGDVDVTSAVITGGGVADDGTTPGNPIMIGGKAVETDGTDPTSVSAEDDVAIFRTDRNRRLLINKAHPNSWKLFEDHTSAQTNNQLKAAPGANLSLYITDIIYSNGATAGSIKLVEDESGTPAQLTQTVYMAINGGAVMHFETPIRMTANKTLGFTSTTVTTHSVEVHGFTAP